VSRLLNRSPGQPRPADLSTDGEQEPDTDPRHRVCPLWLNGRAPSRSIGRTTAGGTRCTSRS